MTDDRPLRRARVNVDWTRYDVPAIWERMQNEDDYFTRMQVGAWKRTAELLDLHHQRLQSLAESLGRAWPGGPGTAADSFWQAVQVLAEAVANTSRDAAVNTAALNNMTDTLMDARTKLAGLNNEWSKASAADRPALKQQAADTMSTADRTAYDYATGLTRTDEYVPPPVTTDEWTPLGPGSGPGTSPTSASPPPQLDAWSPATAGDGPEPTEPVLSSGGIPTPPAVHPAPPLFSGGPGPLARRPVNLIPGVFGPGGPGPWGRTFAGSPQSADGFGGGRSEPGAQHGFQGDRSATDSGGRMPGASAEAESARPTTTGGAPIGGFCGAGRRGGRRPGRGERYTEWEMPTGVAPVFTASPEPTEHDPGPGVFGIDR